MLIQRKILGFEHDGVGVSEFRIRYIRGEGEFSYGLPVFRIPFVAGQTAYTFSVPDDLPLTEGNYILWLTAADAEGNESDPVQLSRFFDFTAPSAPVNFRVL